MRLLTSLGIVFLVACTEIPTAAPDPEAELTPDGKSDWVGLGFDCALSGAASGEVKKIRHLFHNNDTRDVVLTGEYDGKSYQVTYSIRKGFTAQLQLVGDKRAFVTGVLSSRGLSAHLVEGSNKISLECKLNKGVRDIQVANPKSMVCQREALSPASDTSASTLIKFPLHRRAFSESDRMEGVYRFDNGDTIVSYDPSTFMISIVPKSGAHVGTEAVGPGVIHRPLVIGSEETGKDSCYVE